MYYTFYFILNGTIFFFYPTLHLYSTVNCDLLYTPLLIAIFIVQLGHCSLNVTVHSTISVHYIVYFTFNFPINFYTQCIWYTMYYYTGILSKSLSPAYPWPSVSLFCHLGVANFSKTCLWSQYIKQNCVYTILKTVSVLSAE